MPCYCHILYTGLMSPSRTPVAAHRNSILNNSVTTPNASGTLNRRSGGGGGNTFSSSDILQTKLRSLLNTSIDHGQPDVHFSSKMMPESPSSYDQHMQYMSPKKLSHQEVGVWIVEDCWVLVMFLFVLHTVISVTRPKQRPVRIFSERLFVTTITAPTSHSQRRWYFLIRHRRLTIANRRWLSND